MKAINLLLAFWLMPFISFAQVDKDQDPIKSQIREVKLSEKHVYAEATSNVSIPEAKQISLDELHANVIGLFSEAGKNKDEAEKLWSTNEAQCKYIVSQNGDLFQSFIYIPKSLLFPEEAAIAVVATPEEVIDSVVVATPIVAVDSMVSTTVPVVETLSVDIPAEQEFTMDEKTAALFLQLMEPASSSSKIASESSVKKEVAVSANSPKTVVAEKKVEPVTAEPVKTESVKAVKPQVVAENPLNALPESSRKVLEELLKKETYKEAITYLYAMKEEGRMVYGRVKTMTSPENSYLLITKQGQLVTILNKGLGERINLKTNKPDPIKNYVGCGVIWFQVF